MQSGKEEKENHKSTNVWDIFPVELIFSLKKKVQSIADYVYYRYYIYFG
jgi:hypothetical protein